MGIKRLTVRLPEEVHEWLSDRADTKATTVTGEIVSALREVMAQNERGLATKDEVREIAREVALSLIKEEISKKN